MEQVISQLAVKILFDVFVLFKCEKIISYVPLGCILILELFILRNIKNKYS